MLFNCFYIFYTNLVFVSLNNVESVKIPGTNIKSKCMKNLYDIWLCAEYKCEEPPLEPPNFSSASTSSNNVEQPKREADLNETVMLSENCELAGRNGKDVGKIFPILIHHTTTKQLESIGQIKLSSYSSKFCNETFVTNDGTFYRMCVKKKDKRNKSVRVYQKISTFLSPVFIIIPVIVFLATWEIQNVHGWTHFTNACCVFTLYFSWGLRYVLESSLRGEKALNTTLCIWFAKVQHYIHLSVFSWLTIVNFDLYEISAAHPSVKSLDRRRQILRYMRSSSLGWGIPLLYMGFLSLITKIMELTGHYGDEESRNSYEASLFYPEYGRYRCFLAFNAHWIHLFVPTLYFSLQAIYFNVKTFKILTRKTEENMDRAVQKVNVLRNLACLKALTITSICWGCDVARTFLNAYDRSAVLWLRVIFDTLILYQTVPICIIYVCRPHILNHLETTYPKIGPVINILRIVFRVPVKEHDPGLVTHLRVHRKSDATPETIPHNYSFENFGKNSGTPSPRPSSPKTMTTSL